MLIFRALTKLCATALYGTRNFRESAGGDRPSILWCVSDARFYNSF